MILSCVRLASAWILASVVAVSFGAGRVEAQDATTQITVRAGKADNPNYVFARQFSEALVLATNGKFALDVKESQGTVQNVIDAPKNNVDSIFTASRSVILSARRGHKPFTPNRGYYDIRALFPLPAQTVHWVVRQDSGIQSMSDLAGHGFIPGSNGSISQRVTATALQALGIQSKVQLMDMDVATAPNAVMSGKVSGLALAGSFPLPRVTDIAKATPIQLLSLPPSIVTKMVAADDTLVPETIPKGTYPGVDANVSTVAVPTGIYAMRRMSDATAYALTKAFWAQLGALASKNAAWQAITGGTVAQLGIKLHSGALRYYKEAGIAVPAAMR